MIERRIELILKNAFHYANNDRFEFFTTEHLLLALIERDEQTKNVLNDLEVDITEMSSNLRHFLVVNSPKLMNEDESTTPTAAFRRVMDRAIEQRVSADKDKANGLHVLISIMDENESHAVYFIKKQGITKLDLMEITPSLDAQEITNDHVIDGDEEDDPLQKFCVDLNKLAKEGGIDPLIGRDNEIQRTVQVLSRRRKNNPILVGEAGVGKTAIAEGLAKKIVDETVPEVLKNTTIYSVDLGAMVAGSKYRGDFEKRVKSLVNKLISMDNVIIFIDEIHTLLGAGATSDSTMDASNLLKPALSAGQLRCIGATTFKEYKASFEKNAALARRFQKIDVLEPSKAETAEIIRGILPKFEMFHQVKYAPSSAEHVVDLADKFIHDRYFPDKAIDLIDEAGAKARIHSPPKKRVTHKDIEKVLANIAKIPEKTVSKNDKQRLKNIEKRLKSKVFGQDGAVHALAAAIKLSRAGLKTLEKPVGSFLFTGPTGVGKTEVTQQLAHEMGMTFIRFDMSEYMESHTVSRLIGSPPGYVGYEQGGLLTDAVANTPHCVLLLDEIEKAHPDIFNLLLQIMDYGKLTDSNGKSVNFSHVILVMTSNAGAAALEKNNIGFTFEEQAPNTDTDNAIKRIFSPEFRNRLTDVIRFEPLSKPIILRIIDKLLSQLALQLAPQNIELTVNKAAKNWLLDNGYNRLMGARPMARLIDKKIKEGLSEHILFGDLTAGGKVTVELDTSEGALTLRTEKKSLAKL